MIKKLKPNHKGKVKIDSSLLPKLEPVFIFLFVFFLPSQVAYHFWPSFSYLYGLRVDYFSPMVALSDLLFILLLPFLKLPRFGHLGNLDSNRKQKQKYNPSLILGLLVVLVSIVFNIAIADNHWLAFLKWLQVVKLVLVGYIFWQTKYLSVVKKALSFSLIFFSLIGVFQFTFQKTLGGFLYFLGERTFQATTPGIALISILGHSYLRTYSTFSHPNSFAAFMILGAFIVLALSVTNSPRFKLLLTPLSITVLTCVVISLILSFSLGALVALLISVGAILVFFLLPKLKARNGFLLLLCGLTLFISLLTPLLAPKGIFSKRDTKLRIALAKTAAKQISERPLFGFGLNNSLVDLKTFQPVHNIFLLVTVETGLSGLLVVYFLIAHWVMVINDRSDKFTRTIFLGGLIFVLVTSLIDHYWFTLLQNQFILSMFVGLSLRKNR